MFLKAEVVDPSSVQDVRDDTSSIDQELQRLVAVKASFDKGKGAHIKKL